MNWLLFFIIFTLTYFLYIHILHHYKKVNDIDIYDMGYVDKKKLEEVCVLRQPVTFLLEEVILEKYFNLELLSNGYPNMSLEVFDNASNSTISVSLPIKKVEKLLKQNKDYISYNNTTFIKDSITESKLRLLDKYLSPPLTIYSAYDVWLGTNDKKLPIKTETYYREYLYITSGYVECLLKTPNGEKNQTIVLNKSEVLYIPPYWTYEITFKKNAFICVFRYDTLISIFSRLPTIVLNNLKQSISTEVCLKLKNNSSSTIDNNEVSDKVLKKPRNKLSKKKCERIDPSNNVP